MAWESRNGSGTYYTRSKRVNGRVLREYVGTGQIADLAHQVDVAERLKRLATQRSIRSSRDRDTEIDKKLDSFLNLTGNVAQALLLVSGHHQHKRGPWRKRREQKSTD